MLEKSTLASDVCMVDVDLPRPLSARSAVAWHGEGRLFICLHPLPVCIRGAIEAIDSVHFIHNAIAAGHSLLHDAPDTNAPGPEWLASFHHTR